MADLGDAYTEELRRTAVGPFRVQDADPHRVVPLAEALAFLPAVALDPGDGAAGRLRAGGQAPAPAGAEHVLLVDDDGPIAIAEPREGAGLKPVVGFRSA